MSDLAAQYQKVQGDLEDLIMNRQKLETQLQENKIVTEEFETLKDETPIYKLTGNVLLPVEQDEARTNVDKRLEFINGEIDRCEKNIKDRQGELDRLRNELMKQTK
ncbi:similar to Saccharomyces cerevisiae YLR200W YKE2 Subunit of the heterohexameric Gim/prefoldin protein complex involved in the folding of alpha-tubulin, beta-tubulin, and actin [Maudiozyma barnettii]|uniref:Similar to Saccharomyces cerevisiae YLR200W YKE2 Subunit of the heterohexameric Gim/prefoldin protein complex involved in the folding of alpha-tubulin, beta-tubulin, and actin n=1 Tax=Maudiozyma barnettii TaxID=61262 RepID=A0A8H2ZFX9_9SACH|nr:tubulin-binding prefolding complex subunit YKE2 [Kazachstania barnettii]CAB4253959.1 similar to Saccharomyces cerevisiae YLR200W YKE2 Subunit of the heterohexameric Gim/prefoldin protein complex involved in the folding of alpha-tubulin, beta-tubulin, and actin [Kazachstania barnettii]CAD1781709.1 similar to Saccharomyces cerevisiae YLR200W YKE2 Subunit of the heterohexameric Gim/prefoldin protein complex involved in the folding of alpha-tubulin, beta-tubulin, and actin [Kazachstania barnettii]